MGKPKKEKPNRSDGTYEVKVTIGKTPDGKAIRKSFYSSISKTDAKAKAEQYKINQAVAEKTGIGIINEKEQFDTWALKWLEIYKKNNVKDQTYKFTYETNLKKYLIPFFGSYKLTNIKQIDIQRYFNEVKNTSNGEFLSSSVLSKHKMILKSIFDAAIDNDLCYKNPVKNITFPKIAPKQSRPVYTKDELEILKKYALENNRYDIITLINTGIRRSELLGLTWNDIDFKNKSICIQRAVTQTTGRIIIDKPKSTTSNRIIPISNDFINLLQQIPHTSDYFIPGNIPDTPLSPHSYADNFCRFMKKMNKDIGLKILTPHELRHTYGTILRENGVDIYTIQKIMGHADISVTAQIYVHNDIEVLRKQLKLD